MGVLKPLTATDVLFLASVASLLVGVAGRDRNGHWIAGAGWLSFGGFWLYQANAYLAVGRAFLGTVSLATGLVAVYCVRLLVARETIGWRLTAAFGVMGAVFIPYQFITPVFHGVVRLVTVHSAAALRFLGFQLTIVDGDVAAGTAIQFANTPGIRFNLVSACTGLSAIAMFVGFLSISKAPVRRRITAMVGVSVLIYLLNVFRIVVVLGATAGRWFGSMEPLISPLYGISDPARVSYYFAEYVFAQISIVVVLLGVAAVLLRLFPDLDAFLTTVGDRVRKDIRRIRP
mgnify:CR=1 FL=1